MVFLFERIIYHLKVPEKVSRRLNQGITVVDVGCKFLKKTVFSQLSLSNSSQTNVGFEYSEEAFVQLLALGFSEDQASYALQSTQGDVNAAINLLLDQ